MKLCSPQRDAPQSSTNENEIQAHDIMPCICTPQSPPGQNLLVSASGPYWLAASGVRTLFKSSSLESGDAWQSPDLLPPRSTPRGCVSWLPWSLDVEALHSQASFVRLYKSLAVWVLLPCRVPWQCYAHHMMQPIQAVGPLMMSGGSKEACSYLAQQHTCL